MANSIHIELSRTFRTIHSPRYATALSLQCTAAQTQLTGYKYKVIADTRAGASLLTSNILTINNQGEKVLAASLRAGGSGIYGFGVFD